VEVSASQWMIGDKMIFGGIVRDISQRKQMEVELRKSHDELEKKVNQRTAELREANEKLQISQEYLKKFSAMLLSAREDERKNISTTLHDELGSMALSVTSKISIAKEEVKDNNSKAALQALEEGQAAVRKAVDDLRRVAVDLRPPNLGIMGLNASLTDFIDKTKKQTKLKLIFRNELSNKKIMPEDTAIVIYRVIQEALTNIIKHAKAKNARVRLYTDKKNVNLDISDDGVGCNLDKVLYRKGKPKIGIEGMRERVESLGGEFIITSAPKQGTQLKTSLPKK
jgi:signal transduction histidine kinase